MSGSNTAKGPSLRVVATDPSENSSWAGGSTENSDSKYNADGAASQAAASVTSWSPDQERALAEIKQWLAARDKPVFKLWGFAGTGKSTLLAHLARDIRGAVVLTLTNKAASVLRGMGVHACTIHSFAYKFEGTEVARLRERIHQLSQRRAAHREELERLEVRLEKLIDEAARRGLRATGKQYFDEQDPEEMPSLIIVDEASMVSEEHADRLLSFGVPVLAIGDPMQLPPFAQGGVRLRAPFVEGRPDAMLSQIHRQAEGSPIIRLSQLVRNIGGLPGDFRSESNEYGAVRILRGTPPDDALGVEQVIVGSNKTRVSFNRRIRALRGFKDEAPMIGERLVCRRNSRDERALCNGEILTVAKSFGVETIDFGDRRWSGVVVREFDAEPIDVSGEVDMLAASAGLYEPPTGDAPDDCDDLHYGYALTCHFAQGSQWASVLVKDESHFFRQDHTRWLYTAVTRAARELTLAVTGLPRGFRW